MNEYNFMSEDQMKNLFSSLYEGLNHMHEWGICHRDISPDNILISKDLKRAVLIDFGSSSTFTENDIAVSVDDESKIHTKKKVGMFTRTGKSQFMSPEMLAGEKYDETIDIWSLAMVLFELCLK